jgi:transposase
MLSFAGSLKVFLAVEPCDMRKGFNGLPSLVSERLQENPQAGALFVFTNKRQHQTTFYIPIGYGFGCLPVASPSWAATPCNPPAQRRHRR